MREGTYKNDIKRDRRREEKYHEINTKKRIKLRKGNQQKKKC